MAAHIIVDNELDSDHFSSATEQEGEYVGQPVANSANTGLFRLVSSGDIADFTYSGTTTSNGAADGTTVIDSKLLAYGDDYFIGGTVAITSGAANGETKDITDFAQSTGTITMSAFSAQIVSGVTFTLTVAFATRDYRVELTNSGDAGGGDFKWSHDGGTTYFGRDDPNAATWLAPVDNIKTDLENTTAINEYVIQASNGDLIIFYDDSASGYASFSKSTDRGLTWSATSRIDSARNSHGHAAIVFPSGRILFNSNANTGNAYFHYSDDNGDTWSFSHITTLDSSSLWIQDMRLLKSGRVVAAVGSTTTSNPINFIASDDGGVTWSNDVTVISGGATGTVEEFQNGNIMVAYKTASNGIKGKISSDGGATWGSEITLVSTANSLSDPFLIRDIDNSIYCLYTNVTTNVIGFTRSTDDGETWGSPTTIRSGAFYESPKAALVDGHEIFCIYNTFSTNNLHSVRAGIWEVYSAGNNDCPCATRATPQHLINDVSITWQGGAGIDGDIWTIAPAYTYSATNVVDGIPSIAWRSTQDNAAINIVFDMGTNERRRADGVAFFNCNVRTLSFQMNATDSWGAPSVDQSVSFDLATGAVDTGTQAVSGNTFGYDGALSVKDHELAGRYYIRFTSGGESGNTYLIRDNYDNVLILDTTAAISPVNNDTFAVYAKQVWKGFTAGAYRFMRIAISSQDTAEGYYQIGLAMIGHSIPLADDWAIGYSLNHVYDIQELRTPTGGRHHIKGADRRRVFQLQWPASDNGRVEVVSALDWAQGQTLTLLPSTTSPTKVYPVKLVGEVSQRQRYGDLFDMSAMFEEVL